MHDYAIFVQARLGSTRFPKKITSQLAGKRVLDHVIDACLNTGIKTFLLCPEGDASFFNKEFGQVEIFSGSEHDVLRRFYDCAIAHHVKNVIRITSDCPCIPASHIVAVVEEHKKFPTAFVSNVAYEEGSYKSKTSIPDGFDVEVFDFATLKRAYESSSDPNEREHVTKWMRKNAEVHLANLALSIDGKFSIDTQEDLSRLESTFNLLKSLRTLVTASGDR